jgi:hypothetical protein
MEFCDVWVSEYELKNQYKISVVWDWSDNEVYLIWGIDKRYIIEGAPDKFVSGTVYTGDYITYQYLEMFEHDKDSYTENQFFFNREELINKGIIEK